jgi:hypothetical protein
VICGDTRKSVTGLQLPGFLWRATARICVGQSRGEGWIYPFWWSFKRMRNPAEEVGGFVGGNPIAWRLEAERGRGATRRNGE